MWLSIVVTTLFKKKRTFSVYNLPRHKKERIVFSQFRWNSIQMSHKPGKILLYFSIGGKGHQQRYHKIYFVGLMRSNWWDLIDKTIVNLNMEFRPVASLKDW